MNDASKSRGRVRIEPGAKRVRAFLEGRLVVDTLRPLYVWEIPYYPAYYLPLADVAADLVATGEVQRSPSRGDGRRHDVTVDGVVAPGAATTFPDSPFEELRDHVRLDWDAMTSWFEEDEEVFTHPRSPYARIDVLPSSRHVVVTAGDTVLADTTRAHVLHETGLPPRWYIPRVDVRMDRLAPSETVTHCPYKGTTVHFTAPVDGEVKDVAWSYPTPLPESLRVAGLVAFYDDRVTVTVDGTPLGPSPTPEADPD
jgi:uncharacterized protein (DUF427 family)